MEQASMEIDPRNSAELKDASLKIEEFVELKPPMEMPISRADYEDPNFNAFDAEIYGVCGACGQPAIYDAVVEYGRFSCYLTESHAPPHTDQCRDEGPGQISAYRRFKLVVE